MYNSPLNKKYLVDVISNKSQKTLSIYIFHFIFLQLYITLDMSLLDLL